LYTLTGLSNPKPTDLEDTVSFLLAAIITHIANGNIPTETLSFFQDNELSAIGEKVRPVCVCGVLRKLGALEGFTKSMPFNKEYFKDVNFAFEPSGPDQIVHAMQTALEIYPMDVHFYADGINAFNSCNRSKAFNMMINNYPRPFPHIIRAMYNTPSNVWYYGLTDQIHPVSCEIGGAQQGDVWGTWILQPLFAKLKTALSPDGIALVDDSNYCAPHSLMLETILTIQTKGPKYGYHINPDKGTYLLGQYETSPEAIGRKAAFVRLGLNPDRIRIHPDNSHIPVEVAIHYGWKVLGAFIGSSNYIDSQLSNRLQDLRSLGVQVKNFPYIQDRYFLLRFCFGRKINHLMRTIPPYAISTFASAFDDIRKDLLSSIVNNVTPISDQTWMQCRINIKDSGLGLEFLTEILPFAYSASMIVTYPLLQRLFPSTNLFQLPAFQPLFAILPLLDVYIPNITIQQLLDMPFIVLDSLQGVLSTHLLRPTIEAFHHPNRDDILFSTWISSCRNDFSGAWLEAIPSSSTYKFSNLDFRHAILSRLFLPLPLISPGDR
jgi:hypothetical protein